jgi:hypothetical protein
LGDLWLGWHYYLHFAVESGAITSVEQKTTLRKVREALKALATAQADHLRAADPVDQFLRLVPAVLASGQAHLSDFGGGPPDHPTVFGWQEALSVSDDEGPQLRPRGNQMGWMDATHVYLIPDAAFAEVQKVATAQREPITMAPRTLWARLYERKLLAAVDARGGKVRYVTRVSIGGQRVACLQLKHATLFPSTPGATTAKGDSTGDDEFADTASETTTESRCASETDAVGATEYF